MPGLYQKEDDKVAEYNNDGPTMIRIRYVMFAIKRPLRTTYKNFFGDLNVPQPLNNNKGT